MPAVALNGSNGRGARTDPSLPPSLRVGERAPAFKLLDLDGKTVELADLKGCDTLILFWDPGCGFCQRMLPELKAWEANPPPGAPKLVLVSGGSVQENRAMGLTSPVVLNKEFTVGAQFGAGGTPSAVLLDARGRMASPVAAGASAVLELALGRAASASNVSDSEPG